MMKQAIKRIAATFLGFALSMTISVAAQARADLTFTTFSNGGTTINPDGSISVGVTMRITNQGSSSAPKFKISAEAKGHPNNPNGYFALPFTPTMGASNAGFYAFTFNPLAAGRSITVAGKVRFPRYWRNRTVFLRAISDSCASEEFMPEYCRVRESNETNNKSPGRSFFLP